MPNLILKEIRQYGPRVALRRFVKRRHLQAVAYVLLAVFAIGGFAQERAYNDTHRRDQNAALYQITVATCRSGNLVRQAIRQILEDNLTQIDRAEKQHRITHSEAVYDRKLFSKYISYAKNRNCVQVSRPVLKK